MNHARTLITSFGVALILGQVSCTGKDAAAMFFCHYAEFSSPHLNHLMPEGGERLQTRQSGNAIMADNALAQLRLRGLQ